MFVALTAVPVAAKSLLIGRFKAQSIPIWSFAYFRFWAVKTLMRTSPVAAFIGTPLYNAYLRLMGARIGQNVILRCQFAPVCTDLVTIGDNTIVRNETSLLGYRAQSNFIHMGPVTIGSNAFVGEGSVLDIDTAMGNNTQLGHASSLQSGQRVPDGKRYHGSPAVETSSDYCPIEGKNGTALRGVIYVWLILATLLLIAVPAVMILIYYVWDLYCPSTLTSLYCPAISSMSTPLLLALSAAFFFGAVGLGLAAVYVIPRLCMMALRPGVTYPNFGFHYLLQSIIRGVSNSGFFGSLFGDSSFIVTYMRYVGWNLNTVYQTGSNMGTDQKHDNPLLCNIGSRHDGFGRAEDDQHADVGDVVPACRVEDRREQLSGQRHLLPAEWSHRNQHPVRHQDHGPDRRPGARERRAARLAGLRDSAHGRPRSRHERVVRRADASRPAAPEELVQFRHGLDLPRQPVGGSVCRVRARASRIRELRSFRHLRVLRSQRGAHRRNMAFFIVLEGAILGFKRLKPQLASIYDPYFWWHERYWKLNAFPILAMFAGTPFRGMLLRAMGMKVGAKLFDWSIGIPERSLTEVGDYANLNEGCVLQAHSLEEGVFKSDYIRLGNRCSLGPGALIHYGVSTGDDVVLDADSFLMKGEILDSHTGWCGNPAKLARRHVARAEVCVQHVADATVRDEFVPQTAAESIGAGRQRNERQGQAQEGDRRQLGSGGRA